MGAADSPAGTSLHDDVPVQPGVRLRLRRNELLIEPDAPPPDLGQGTQPGAEALDQGLRRRLAASAQGPLVYDRRRGAYHALPLAFRSIREELERHAYRVAVDFDPRPALPFSLPEALAQQPRPYQQEAVEAWLGAGGRGVVVLPTGAGKTLVALLAIQRLGLCTLIVVPTVDLLTQWRRAVVRVLAAPPEHVGVYGGGSRQLRALTIITYDSAAIHTGALHQFGLLVFDEVHHLPAASYRLIAEGAVAPHRLGLTATPDRTDGLHAELARLVGSEVYHRAPDDLRRQQHIARYEEVRIDVDLGPGERRRYERLLARYRDYLRRRRIRIDSPEDFERLVVWRSATDPAARAAFLAHTEARRLALDAPEKLHVVVDLLRRHRDDRVLIFCEYNALVVQLSRQLAIPAITHRTPAAERRLVLDRFRSGRYSKLVTGRVLNEGVDVPDANVAIVLSGSATRREYIQRLGRVLRPKEQAAVLYEVVTKDTSEVFISHRRRAAAGL